MWCSFDDYIWIVSSRWYQCILQNKKLFATDDNIDGLTDVINMYREVFWSCIGEIARKSCRNPDQVPHNISVIHVPLNNIEPIAGPELTTMQLFTGKVSNLVFHLESYRKTDE